MTTLFDLEPGEMFTDPHRAYEIYAVVKRPNNSGQPTVCRLVARAPRESWRFVSSAADEDWNSYADVARVRLTEEG